MLTDRDPFLRNSDGMIDFDRYSSDATAMRRQVMQETSQLTSFLKLVVVVALLLGTVALAPSKPDDVGDGIAATRSSNRTASHAAPVSPPLF